MAYEEAPPPNDTLDKNVRRVRGGCGCLSAMCFVLAAVALCLSRVT